MEKQLQKCEVILLDDVLAVVQRQVCLSPLIIIIEHYISGKIGNTKKVLFACLI